MLLITQVLYTIAVLLLTGNMVLGLYWKLLADRTRNPEIIEHTFRGIFLSDRVFTLPSLLLANLLNWSVNKDRHVWSIPLSMPALILIASVFGVMVFVVVVHPIRQKLFTIARVAAGDAGFDKQGYEALSRKWALWGLIESAPVLGLLMLSLL